VEEFVKITEDFLEENEDILPYLVHDVKCAYIDCFQSKKDSCETCLIDCESPVEQLLALALEEIDIVKTSFYNPFVDVVAVDPQQDVECNGKVYRTDFLIPVIYKNQGIGTKKDARKIFVIECDGHEFHQKTKEQVEKDYQRVRDLQMEMYEVIRFSGTEIWRNPHKCAMEILKIILSKCKYIKDE